MLSMKRNVLFLALCALIGTAYGQQATACLGVTDGLFVRNSLGCSHWHICQNNAVRGSGPCPEGFNFDPLEQHCGFINSVDCTVCSRQGIQHIRSKRSCSEYVECDNGIGIVRYCSDGLYFNPETAQCDLMANVVCDIPTDPTTCPPITTDPSVPSTEWTPSTPDPSDPTTEWTPSTPDPSDPTTDWTPSTDCPTTPGVTIECSGVQVHHAHPHDCSKFFICFNNQAQLMQCPSDLHWNQFVNACDKPQYAGCVIQSDGTIAEQKQSSC